MPMKRLKINLKKKDGADYMIDIKNLRKLREGEGLTQAQLAAKVGVSISTIFRWEKEKHIPHPERLKKLNRIFSHLSEDN